MRERPFFEIHSMPVWELEGNPCPLEDCSEVRALRKAGFYEELMELAYELSWQLRYRDAIKIYDWAVLLRPGEHEARRLRGARYLSTLQPEKALPDLRKAVELGADPGDTGYSIGLCYYFMGDYAAAMEEFEEVYPLFTAEMGVATMFWHTAAAIRSGKEPTLMKLYREDMDVGHHTSYRFAIRLLSGLMTPEEALTLMEQEEEDLEYAMMAYGTLLYCEREGDFEKAKELRERILRRDSFWIGYAYLAAWNDRRREAA